VLGAVMAVLQAAINVSFLLILFIHSGE